MRAFSLLALSLLPACSRAIPGVSSSQGALATRSQLYEVPTGFLPSHDGPVLDDMLRLSFRLPQINLSELHSALLEISDPTSSSYGQHLTKTEVERLLTPRPDSVQAVVQWLTSNDIDHVLSGDKIAVRVPVQQANTLLAANFTMYIHEDTNTIMTRTLSYSLPAHLQDHITFVYPTTQFIPPIQRRVAATVANSLRRANQMTSLPSDCAQTITPGCLQNLYHIPTVPASSSNNSLYVSGFGGQVASEQDLQAFLSQLRPDIKNGTFSVLPIGGALASNTGTDEADCDIQYTVGLATNVPTTFVTTASHTGGIVVEDLMETVDFLLAQEEVPLVLSTSYVFAESDVGLEYANTLCNAYAQLGARGTSVIFASGDCGIAGGFLDDPAECDDKPFVPTFPSTCPFVTSVGATDGIAPEFAASFSSGGFSNFFSRPSYQDNAVQRYLDAFGGTYSGRYNSSGRAYPDVSIHGVNYLYNIGGTFQLAYGTSTSAPTFASIVALLNDRLLAAGKRPLGFLNPLLYSTGLPAFTDITNGSNPGCGTDGFPADVGWDPVSGLGMPDYDDLFSIVTGEVIAHTSQNIQNRAARNALMDPFVVWTLTVVLLLYNGMLSCT